MDETTIYSCDSNIDSVIIKLERDLQELLEWYTANGMSGNRSNFQIMFLGLQRKNTVCRNINGQLITDSHSLNHLNTDYIWEFFAKKDVQYDLRTKELCKLPSVSSRGCVLNFLSFRGSYGIPLMIR